MIQFLGEDVLTPTLGEALGDDINNARQDGQDEAAEWRQYNNRKAKQTKEASEDVQHRTSAIISIWASAAVEHINNFLQHKDAEGNTLIDTVNSKGPNHAAMLEVTGRATSSPETYFLLPFQYRHFSTELGLDIFENQEENFSKIASIVAWLSPGDLEPTYSGILWYEVS